MQSHWDWKYPGVKISLYCVISACQQWLFQCPDCTFLVAGESTAIFLLLISKRNARSKFPQLSGNALRFNDTKTKGVVTLSANFFQVFDSFSFSAQCLKITQIVPKRQENSNTGCPNKFGIRSEIFASEASYVYKKLYFAPKIAFWAFFVNCKKW